MEKFKAKGPRGARGQHCYGQPRYGQHLLGLETQNEIDTLSHALDFGVAHEARAEYYRADHVAHAVRERQRRIDCWHRNCRL